MSVCFHVVGWWDNGSGHRSEQKAVRPTEGSRTVEATTRTIQRGDKETYAGDRTAAAARPDVTGRAGTEGKTDNGNATVSLD